MKYCSGLLLGVAALAGCASLPSDAPALTRTTIRDFTLEGRFALRTQVPNQPAQSGNGRLSWTHQGETDRILLASPLGFGMAEIEASPAGARLITADGNISESADAELLTEAVTGQRLPVRQLPAWLVGRPRPEARTEHDTAGRPLRVNDADWQIDYLYDAPDPDALPARLTLTRGQQIELKLRIETWKATP